MKILCVGYREWAIRIYKNLSKSKKHKIYYHFKKTKLNQKISKVKPEIILFYGWSWMIKKRIYNTYSSFMLHPSPLPKYRGGSPLQNQIINGEKKSAVTIFKINEILDGGDIYFQKKMSLNGSISQIFQRIVRLGTEGTLKIVNDKRIKPMKQNPEKVSFYKRRKPKQSEITLNEIKNKSAEYINNKIRMLDDPYPNAYIKLRGKKLFIKDYIIK